MLLTAVLYEIAENRMLYWHYDIWLRIECVE